MWLYLAVSNRLRKDLVLQALNRAASTPPIGGRAILPSRLSKDDTPDAFQSIDEPKRKLQRKCCGRDLLATTEGRTHLAPHMANAPPGHG